MDVIVLQNMDELFDDSSTLWEDPRVMALYTYDWTMARPPWGTNAPAQGGFVVARPDLETFRALVEVVREGDFRTKGGWAGSGVGNFWGGMTIQGLVPYFFEKLRPGAGRALDNCVYNNMANNPRSVGGFGKGDCRDGTKPPDTCKDCRLVDPGSVKTVHFTICQKPWTCSSLAGGCPYCPLCAKFHKRWFDLRRELETEWGTYHLAYTGSAPDRQGMCGRHEDGSSGYKPVPINLVLHNASRTRRWRDSWLGPWHLQLRSSESSSSPS